MSAGFEVDGEVFWGTNGAIEAYVDTLAAVAVEKYGDSDPLSAFFRGQSDAFYTGAVIVLDECLADEGSRARLLEAFDVTTERLLLGDTFSDYGRRWAATVMGMLRRKLAGSPLSRRPPPPPDHEGM
jgi:hypothetical protein